MGLTKHPDKPKGECVMEFRDKPMQNLIRIKEKEICKNVQELLLDGEQIVGAYKTVRDQAVFTTHRIFMVDMQGMTGTRQEIFVLPYRKILHYGIKTAGFGDPLQTSELTVCFADEHEAKFGFIGRMSCWRWHGPSAGASCNRTNVKRPFRLLTPERAFYIAVICEKRRMSKGQQATRSLRPASSM